MSDQEKLIARLEDKDFLDEQSVAGLRKRLRKKLKTEAEKQEKEMVDLQKEVQVLKIRMSS